MCFYNDYDWQAEVHSKNDVEAARPQGCYECGAAISQGTIARHIIQRQYQDCRCASCMDQFIGGFLVENCPNAEFGESFECWICADCCKILKAIEVLEEKEGCPAAVQQPSYGGLYEEAFAQDEFEANKYAKAAAEMFPELATQRLVADALNAVIED